MDFTDIICFPQKIEHSAIATQAQFDSQRMQQLMKMYTLFSVLLRDYELLLYGKELHKDSSKCFLLCYTEKKKKKKGQ